MNTETLSDRPKRGAWMKILFGLIWFFFIRFVSNFFIAAFVGFMAGFQIGFGAGSQQEGSVAGRAAALAFFMSYGVIIFLIQLLVTAAISFMGLLPGTGKYKSLI